METSNNEIVRPKEFNMVRLSMTFDKNIHSDYVVDSMDKAIYLINDYLSDCPNEVYMGIALDADRKPICCTTLGIGNEHSIGDVKSNIFRFALVSCADSIVLIHNHPRSSRLELSNQDHQELSNIQQISSMLGIRLRDFIVVGNQKHERAYYSWNEKRLIMHSDFIDNIEYLDLKDPILPGPEATIDEANRLLKKSKYNSPESVAEKLEEEKAHGNRKGFFRLFN